MQSQPARYPVRDNRVRHHMGGKLVRRKPLPLRFVCCGSFADQSLVGVRTKCASIAEEMPITTQSGE